MNARFKLAPCAVAIALLSTGCAMLPFKGGAQQAAGPRAPAAVARPAPAELARRVPQPAELEAVFRQGREDLMAGRQRAAVERLQFVIEHDPRHVEALNALAVAVAEMGRQPEAVALLRRAVTYSPGAVHLRNNLGYALYRAGDFAQARAELQAALQLQPGNAQALRNLALLDAAPVAAVPPAPAALPTPAAMTAAPPVPAAVPAVPAAFAASPAVPAALVTPPPMVPAAATVPQPVQTAGEPAVPAARPGFGAPAGRVATQPGIESSLPRDARPASRAETPLAPRRESAGHSGPPPARPAPRPAHAEPRLVVQAPDAAAHLSDRMALRILGLEDSGFVPATARAADGVVQRVRVGGPDRRFDQRPVRGDAYGPQLIRARPVAPASGAAPVPLVQG